MAHINIYLPVNSNFSSRHQCYAIEVDLFNEKQIHYDIYIDRIEFRGLILSDRKNIVTPTNRSTSRIFTIYGENIVIGKYLIEDDNYKDGILTIWFEDVIK